MSGLDFDVIVLGGGSAGSTAAAAAVAAGARTALVNAGEVGGLCILRGCMPTKAMLASAHAASALEEVEKLGLRAEGRLVPDFGAIMARKDAQVSRFQRAKQQAMEAQGYELITGRGRFVEGGGFEVEGRPLRGGRYVIATGSRPIKPPIPGLESVASLTSDDLMRLDEQPRSLLILGAGAIGLEFADFFSRIGTETVLVNRSPLLSHYCSDSGRELHAALAARPRLRLLVPADIESVEPAGGEIAFNLSGEGGRLRERAGAFLIATGRAAELEGLGLEHLGLGIEAGSLRLDEGLRTTREDVWVAGDATGTDQVLHLANQEGKIAGHNASVGRNERLIDRRLRMECFFTDPPFAHVGLTPRRAVELGREVALGRARFAETGRAITMGVEHGLWTLVVDPRTREILGSTILGPRADDLIHLVALLMHRHARVEEIFDLPWYHPTLSEVMLDVARDALRSVR